MCTNFLTASKKSIWRIQLLIPVTLMLLSPSAAPGQMPPTVLKSTGTKSLPCQLPSDVKHIPDLTYRETEKGPLQLDVVAPPTGEGPFPVVVIIHAIGPWAKDRKFYLPQAAEFAREGCIGVVISYRHTPDVAYPKAIEDAEAAIRWLRTHSTKYKIDPNRIAAMGYSGGGALACLMGMNRQEKLIGNSASTSGRVQAVVAYYPPSDFTQLHQDCTNGKVPFPQGFLIASGFETWFNGPPGKVPVKYLQASPINHVHTDMAPILLIHGRDDVVVPIAQSQTFVKKTTATKGRVTLLELPGAGHGFDEENTVNAQIAKNSAQTFLYGHLTPARTSLAAMNR